MGLHFTDLKNKKIFKNMKKEQKRHEKQEGHAYKHGYKNGAKKVMPCEYKKKGKRDAS